MGSVSDTKTVMDWYMEGLFQIETAKHVNIMDYRGLEHNEEHDKKPWRGMVHFIFS